ncbi:MAG: 23S rRNA (pseudouridine(1915)-N(3))-methyltransferase RlmH [Pseudomonadota bacterium]
MKLVIACIGRMKSGPEKELFERYIERAQKSGRALGYKSISVSETSEDRAVDATHRKRNEAAALLSPVTDNQSRLVVFDEHAPSLSSPAFSKKLTNWKDGGVPSTVFAIGGPDGLDENVRQQADLEVSFGRLTMPHQIVRVLVAEQLYRAISIEAGHPYHRE